HQNSKIQHHYPTLSQKKEKPASVWDNCVCFTPNRAIQYDANNVGRNILIIPVFDIGSQTINTGIFNCIVVVACKTQASGIDPLAS
ncbi:MAG: hypothetical protein R8M38_08825, partial [Mariprofundaceae bacterium]